LRPIEFDIHDFIRGFAALHGKPVAAADNMINKLKIEWRIEQVPAPRIAEDGRHIARLISTAGHLSIHEPSLLFRHYTGGTTLAFRRFKRRRPIRYGYYAMRQA